MISFWLTGFASWLINILFSGVFPSNSTPSLVTMETNCSGGEFHLLSCYNPPATPTQQCATGMALGIQCRGECVCVCVCVCVCRGECVYKCTCTYLNRTLAGIHIPYARCKYEISLNKISEAVKGHVFLFMKITATKNYCNTPWSKLHHMCNISTPPHNACTMHSSVCLREEVAELCIIICVAKIPMVYIVQPPRLNPLLPIVLPW